MKNYRSANNRILVSKLYFLFSLVSQKSQMHSQGSITSTLLVVCDCFCGVGITENAVRINKSHIKLDSQIIHSDLNSSCDWIRLPHAVKHNIDGCLQGRDGFTIKENKKNTSMLHMRFLFAYPRLGEQLDCLRRCENTNIRNACLKFCKKRDAELYSRQMPFSFRICRSKITRRLRPYLIHCTYSIICAGSDICIRAHKTEQNIYIP